MKRTLLSLMLLMASLLSFAYDFEVDGIRFNILSKDDLTCEVTKSVHYGDVVIPEQVTNEGMLYSVTSIGERAFQSCTGLTSITIPNSVKSIGYFAFSYCSGLTSITIPNSVTSIGSYAFYGCSGLTSITIGNGVTYIGDSAFFGCSSLTDITIGNGVTNIGYSAFSGCSNIEKAEINSDRILQIPSTSNSSVFYSCQATVKEIIIGNSVTSIGSSVFSGCSGLTSITFPSSVTSIGYRAFNGCSGLTSITIPNSVMSIGDEAFWGCSSLTSITIPNSVTSIGSHAFSGCSGLTSVHTFDLTEWCSIYFKDYLANPTYYAHKLFLNGEEIRDLIIPEDVDTIKDYAFYGCSGLTSITIPNSVKSIGEDVFRDCSNLPVEDGIRYADCVALEAIDKSKTTYSLKANTRFIHSSAFSGCSGLTSITIPNGVTSIGSSAFSGCSSLTSITIPNGVTSIGVSTFYNCSSLASLTIPSGVTSIEYSAFSGCEGLTSITIPNSVTSIGKYAFRRCSGLTSITIGNGVTSIGNDVFLGCSNIEKAEINSDRILQIKSTSSSSVFYSCRTTVKEIIIGNSVTSIGESAFSGCSNLTSVTIDNSVTGIGESVFSGCSNLTNITIPTCVTSIGESAFSGCSSLTDITIPVSVTSIGNDAFAGCSSLPVTDNLRYADCYIVEAADKTLGEYKLKDNTRFIGNNAFSKCSNLRKIELPKALINIGASAFSGCSVLSSLTVKAHTPPVCGSSALSGINKAACQLYIPYGTTADYQAAAQWKDFIYYNELEEEIEEDTDLEKPTIALENGMLSIRSNVKGAKRLYDITTDDVQEGTASKDVILDLTGIYYITAYIMTSDGKKSTDATAVLVWVNPSLYDDLDDSVLSMEARKALLLRGNGDHIVACGTEAGELLELYSLDGMALDKVRAEGEETRLGNALQKGQTYIVRAGDCSVKFRF